MFGNRGFESKDMFVYINGLDSFGVEVDAVNPLAFPCEIAGNKREYASPCAYIQDPTQLFHQMLPFLQLRLKEAVDPLVSGRPHLINRSLPRVDSRLSCSSEARSSRLLAAGTGKRWSRALMGKGGSSFSCSTSPYRPPCSEPGLWSYFWLLVLFCRMALPLSGSCRAIQGPGFCVFHL